jgi:hypothetical protein
MYEVRCLNVTFHKNSVMTGEDMKQRTKNFAFETAQFIMQLEYSVVNKAYSSQLIRCSSSVGANY